MPARRFGEYFKEDIVASKRFDSDQRATPGGSPGLVTEPSSPTSNSERYEKEVIASNDFSEEFQVFCKYCVPCIALTMTFIILMATVMTSGGMSAEGTPRVALIVFEGLKGTAFHRIVTNTNRAPHLARLCKLGQCSKCLTIDDGNCAHTQGGPLLGSQHTWESAPGLASILTGVNAQRHGVNNNSEAAMRSFAVSSKQYPSIARIVTDRGGRVATIATSKLLTTLSGSGTCTNYGVLDYECGADMSQRCLRSHTCNLAQRVLTTTTDEIGIEEAYMADEIRNVFSSGAPDLLIMHTNKIARNAEDASQPDYYYSESSLPYTAELYMLDAVIGQLLAVISQRTLRYKENWLVLVTSSHGGLYKSVGLNDGDDEVVPLVIAPITSAPIMLQPQNAPAVQMDIVPTILRWLDINPEELNPRVHYDGNVQSICTNGKLLRNCSEVL